MCSDKITTTDVTCLPLDVSDHTGTTYTHQNVWHKILEVIQYLSAVAGKAPFFSQALHLGSLSIPLVNTGCVCEGAVQDMLRLC